MALMTVILCILYFLAKLALSNFNCASISSLKSGPGDNEISITCNSTFPTMVSCGFRGWNFWDAFMDGAEMSSDGTSCIAQNGNNGQGVAAIARYGTQCNA